MNRKLIVTETARKVSSCFTGGRAPSFAQVVQGVITLTFTAEYALTRRIDLGIIEDADGDKFMLADYKFPTVITNMAEFVQVYFTDALADAGAGEPLWDVCSKVSIDQLRATYITDFTGLEITDDEGHKTTMDEKWLYVMSPSDIEELAFRWNSYIRCGTLSLSQMDKKKNNIFSVGMFLGADSKMHYLSLTGDTKIAATLQLLEEVWKMPYKFTDTGNLFPDSKLSLFVRSCAISEKKAEVSN